MVAEVIGTWAFMVLSINAGIPLLTGDCCISIRGFSHKNVQIVCTSKANLENAMQHVQNGSNANLVPAEYLIFQNTSDHWLHT
jgi:hypothetical protein